jgi:hypothetical protein
MAQFQNNHGGVHIYNLITIGATNIVNADGTLIQAKDNLAVNVHPFWTHIVSYIPKSSPLSTAPQPDTEKDDELESLTDRINVHLNEDCYRFRDCVDLRQPVASGCYTGYTRVGFDRGGCSYEGVSL